MSIQITTSITYVLSIADKLDPMGHKWITGLANCKFHIHYKSGKSNVEADVLSRIDWEKCDETIQTNSIQAIVAAAIMGDVANIEAASCSIQGIESFLPISSDNISISKAITRSSRSELYDMAIWNMNHPCIRQYQMCR